jgi:hypothetical protein
MVSEAMAHLPAAVSLLLLAALFMQISGVSLALTWPHRLCSLRVLLCVSLCYRLSPFQAHWGRWHRMFIYSSGQHVYLQLTWEVGLPPSPVEFSSLHHFYKLSRSWLLGMCSHSCLLWPSLFIQFCEGFPSPSLRCSGRPTLFVTCLYCCYCLLLSLSFFLWMGVSLSRGLCWSGPGMSVGVPCTA